MMNDDDDVPLSQHELRSLRNQLPEQAFGAAPVKLITLTAHGLIVFASFFASGHTSSLWITMLSAAVAGHSIACIGFLAHELSHGCILKSRPLTWVAARVFWSLALVSPTMWRRAHNQTHHPHLNTQLDCDRRFHIREASRFRRCYVLLLYPHSELVPWNPLVWFYMNVYFLRNTLAALLPAFIVAPFVPSMPIQTKGDALRVYLDLLIILLVQVLLAAIGSLSFSRFLLMLVASQATAAFVSMAYIFTNHFLNPIREIPDPLSSTTSVIVPKWLDWLHSHYSYHTEHHLFPSLSSNYYPQLSALLQQRYPERYERIPIMEAWRRLWQQPGFASDLESSNRAKIETTKL